MTLHQSGVAPAIADPLVIPIPAYPPKKASAPNPSVMKVSHADNAMRSTSLSGAKSPVFELHSTWALKLLEPIR
ncbi:MAG: hypothetical protein COB29_03200 [Sulfitobacter sp.]|nr:hypothetical protein [Roseobacter sp.]MBV49864.1 hypothetical protein [Roseobacter sp.]PHR09678.1 MAG: hypothetical protein COB29_03200 [Sulfitobacter sp.]